MLTDIFANRYADLTLWESFEERDRCFLVQAFGIVSEQLYPYYSSEKAELSWNVEKWKLIHDLLSTELGLKQLSKRYVSTSQRNYVKPWVTVCDNFICVDADSSGDPDRLMKERMSFFEIAFRTRWEQVLENNKQRTAEGARLSDSLTAFRSGRIKLPKPAGKTDKELIDEQNARHLQSFLDSANELNERMRQAGYSLHYHNGFVQLADDNLLQEQVEEPFWSLVADKKWQNVDLDMKEAIDRRDGGRRDPSHSAAKALESTLKIISSDKDLTTGKEKGAHNFIDNLASKRGGHIIDKWEAESLKHFFTYVRNPLGHGPGGEPMPELDSQQTNWAIEYSMISIKSLIHRL